LGHKILKNNYKGNLSAVKTFIESKSIDIDDDEDEEFFKFTRKLFFSFSNVAELNFTITALMLASMQGHNEIVQYLLDYGADPSKRFLIVHNSSLTFFQSELKMETHP
jgi:ankyrin repeat protein